MGFTFTFNSQLCSFDLTNFIPQFLCRDVKEKCMSHFRSSFCRKFQFSRKMFQASVVFLTIGLQLNTAPVLSVDYNSVALNKQRSFGRWRRLLILTHRYDVSFWWDCAAICIASSHWTNLVEFNSHNLPLGPLTSYWCERPHSLWIVVSLIYLEDLCQTRGPSSPSSDEINSRVFFSSSVLVCTLHMQILCSNTASPRYVRVATVNNSTLALQVNAK